MSLLLPIGISAATLAAVFGLKMLEKQASEELNAIVPVDFDFFNPLASLTSGTLEFAAFIKLTAISAAVWAAALIGIGLAGYLLFKEITGVNPAEVAAKAAVKTAVKAAKKTPHGKAAKVAAAVIKEFA